MKPAARGPRSLPPLLQRALAAALIAALWLASLFALSLDLIETLAGALLFGLPLLILAALLRPWSLLMRLRQPLAPRFAAMALLAPSPLWLLQRDALVQALGWTITAFVALGLAVGLPQPLAPRLLGTPLQGLAPTLAWAAALLVALPLGAWLHGLPRRWARARLAGGRDGAATSDALALAANAMLLLPVLPVLLHLLVLTSDGGGMMGGGGRYQPDGTVAMLLPAMLAWWALHALLRQRLAGAPPARAALWLVVLPHQAAALPGAAATGGAAPPPEAHTLLALAHQLAGHWRMGPVTVLLPDNLAAGGEHLHAALIAGRAAALFPTLPVQLADWQQTLPPPARWAALPLRELHLPRRWMAGAAALLLQPGDRLLVLADGAAELSAWQALLLGRPGRVFRLGESEPGDTGPAVAVGGRDTTRLAHAALALLQALRPQLETVAAAPGTDAPVEASGALAITASAAAATHPGPGLGLPALPSVRRLSGFVGLSALLLLAGFVSLRLQLDAQSAAVASAYAGLRLRPAPAATATAAATAAAATPTATAAGPASVPVLQALLAPDIANGLLAVGDQAGRSVITLRADGLFEPGEAALNPSVEPLLARLAQTLGRLDADLAVFGHTDNQPVRSKRYPSNWEFSAARANTVLNKLAEGVDRSRLKSAAGAADGTPVASNATPEGRAANRRIEILLLPKPTAATAPAAGATNNMGNVDVPAAPSATPANQAPARAKK